ncbi:MAG: PspC domain-containing protein [bacterium]|nr:PspC domain-containing protein [bacterium]MCP5066883.1 PspC domain-containing protein [bacterium]
MNRIDLEDRPKALTEWHRGHPEGRIAGVCAGLAAEFDIPITLVRAGFLLGGLLGPSVILTVGLYGVLWFLMPGQPSAESGLDRVVDAITSLSGEAREHVERSDADFDR